MTQCQIDRAVAAATGESLDVVRRLGFSLVEDHTEEPTVVDWDALESQRGKLIPDRQNPSHRRAA